MGAQILAGIEFLTGAARVVAQHHERWDGTGYPEGRAGTEIDLNARIFAVADAFDAITSDRVYRAGRSYEAAVRELKQEAGRQFDPEVIAAFLRIPPVEWDELRARAARARRKAGESHATKATGKAASAHALYAVPVLQPT